MFDLFRDPYPVGDAQHRHEFSSQDIERTCCGESEKNFFSTVAAFASKVSDGRPEVMIYFVHRAVTKVPPLLRELIVVEVFVCVCI